MRRILMMVAVLLAASPALAASAPEGLIEQLNTAAQRGDARAFRAALSADTRRAMAQADAAKARVDLAQKNFDIALKERFGTVASVGGTPVARTGLAGLTTIALVGVGRRTPRSAQLRLRTVTSGPRERAITTEYTLPAVVENGEWKLDLTAAERGVVRAYRHWQAAYEQVTRQIRAGAFSNHLAAQAAVANARRPSGEAGGAG